MKFIVGLGNPGREYDMTRHNVGFMVLDELAARHGLSFRRSFRFPARIAKGKIGAVTVWLVKPQTFMNRSGQAVAPILKKKKGQVSDLVTVFDDVALMSGQLRVRAQGSAGGHNGVQSVLNALGDGAFGRIRVGIGPKPDKLSLSDYVLGSFSEEELPGVANGVRSAADAVEGVCNDGVERTMNRFNRRSGEGEQN